MKFIIFNFFTFDHEKHFTYISFFKVKNNNNASSKAKAQASSQDVIEAFPVQQRKTEMDISLKAHFETKKKQIFPNISHLKSFSYKKKSSEI